MLLLRRAVQVSGAALRSPFLINRRVVGNKVAFSYERLVKRDGRSFNGIVGLVKPFLNLDGASGEGARRRSFGTNSTQDDDEKVAKANSILTVPNVLTLSRIAMTPYLSWLILDGQFKYACIGLGLMGFSDYLDGVLARTRNQQTVFGSIMDPIADKVLITTLALTEGYAGLLPVPLVALIVGRDVFLVLGGFYYRAKTKPKDVAFFDTTHEGVLKVAPSLLSKTNTCGQIGLLTFVLTSAACGMPTSMYIDAMIWMVGSTTFLSGADYLYNARKYLPDAPDEERK